MPANLGMIAFGKVKQLEKRLVKLEEQFEELKKQIREENLRPAEESEGKV